jgi:hypothetical protein
MKKNINSPLYELHCLRRELRQEIYKREPNTDLLDQYHGEIDAVKEKLDRLGIGYRKSKYEG